MTQRQNLIRVLIPLTLAVFCLAFAQPAFAEAGKIPQRSDIDDKYKWKVEDIYPDLESWEKDYSFLEENISRFEPFKGRLGDSPKMLLSCLQLSDSLNIILEDLYIYAHLKFDEDQRVSESQELSSRISALNSRIEEATAFVSPEILAIDKDRLHSFVTQEPGLEIYRFYLEDLIRQSEHVLSAEEEAILALADPLASSPRRIFNMLTNADITYGSIIDEDGNEIELTRQRAYKLMESPDRRVRRDARTAYNNAYLKLVNTLAATLESSIKRDYFLMKARGYNNCLEMSLDKYNIPTSVVHNLVEAVNANLEPLHKWTSIRKRILGYDTLYVWDLGVPLMHEQRREYSYEEAEELIPEGLRPLGEAYLKDFEKGLNSGWVDVYETQGKRGGAYSWGSYRSHPYVLLNYNGTLDNVFTLAHEMGHAVHRLYAFGNQPYVYANNPIFTAEVASICNEAILMKYMLGHAKDKKEKMYLLEKYIEDIMGTFYTQVMFSEFELAIHERIESGQAVSADYFRRTYRDIYQKYWGPELVIDEVNDLGGMRIRHFYRQYYVYQYATCYAAAQMLSQRILEGDKKALNDYMKFLTMGSSKYPVDILKDAGVDMTTPEPIERTIKLFGELVDQMEQLLDES